MLITSGMIHLFILSIDNLYISFAVQSRAFKMAHKITRKFTIEVQRPHQLTLLNDWQLIDPNLCCHMASIDQNELIHCLYKAVLIVITYMCITSYELRAWFQAWYAKTNAISGRGHTVHGFWAMTCNFHQRKESCSCYMVMYLRTGNFHHRMFVQKSIKPKCLHHIRIGIITTIIVLRKIITERSQRSSHGPYYCRFFIHWFV